MGIRGGELDERLVEISGVEDFTFESQQSFPRSTENFGIASSVGNVGVSLVPGDFDVVFVTFFRVIVGIDGSVFVFLLPFKIRGDGSIFAVENSIVGPSIYIVVVFIKELFFVLFSESSESDIFRREVVFVTAGNVFFNTRNASLPRSVQIFKDLINVSLHFNITPESVNDAVISLDSGGIVIFVSFRVNICGAVGIIMINIGVFFVVQMSDFSQLGDLSSVFSVSGSTQIVGSFGMRVNFFRRSRMTLGTMGNTEKSSVGRGGEA